MSDSATPWTAACQAHMSSTLSQSLLKFMSIESVILSNPLIFCCPLLLLPSIFPSIGVFSYELSLCIRWLKYWSFSISPYSEYSGLISFRIGWLYLLAVQGTLKSLLQHHTSKASIPRCSDFFVVQLSYPHMTTGNTIALTLWTFVGKVMSLLLNILSRFVIVFLPRSKHLLISWLQSLSTVKPKKVKSHCFYFFPFYLPWSDCLPSSRSPSHSPTAWFWYTNWPLFLWVYSFLNKHKGCLCSFFVVVVVKPPVRVLCPFFYSSSVLFRSMLKLREVKPLTLGHTADTEES